MAVVPQGGNTGLVGGSVPVFDEVLAYSFFLLLIKDHPSGLLSFFYRSKLKSLSKKKIKPIALIIKIISPKGWWMLGERYWHVARISILVIDELIKQMFAKLEVNMT